MDAHKMYCDKTDNSSQVTQTRHGVGRDSSLEEVTHIQVQRAIRG